MAFRTAAVCSGYLFVAGGLTDSQRGRTKVIQALQLARQILAFYLFCNAYMCGQVKKIALRIFRTFLVVRQCSL